VLGESLLNDGISVVMFRMFQTFAEIGGENLITIDYVSGIISFFIIAGGGVLIGLIVAVIAAFTTKYTKHVTILNPVFVMMLPYGAYLTAELCGMSSILAIVFCGLAMRQYIKANINEKGVTSINYFVHVMAMLSETVIFVFLGLSTVSADHHWDSAFIILTLVFCIVYRALGVVVFCKLLNRGRVKQYTRVDQFILAYGGLRGAVAYGLVVALPDHIPAKNMFVTCCIVVIYFTVFLQGMTLKPLANFLQVEKKVTRTKDMTEYIYDRLIDYTMSGMEDIAGEKGHHWLRNMFEKLNKNYLKPLLINKKSRRKMDDSNLMRAYKKMQLREAKELMNTNSADLTKNQLFIDALVSHMQQDTPSVAVVANGDLIMPKRHHDSKGEGRMRSGSFRIDDDIESSDGTESVSVSSTHSVIIEMEPSREQHHRF